MVPVGLFDIFKAAFPTWLAFSVLDLGYGFAIAAGLSAIIGHKWSVFFRLFWRKRVRRHIRHFGDRLPMGRIVIVIGIICWLAFKKHCRKQRWTDRIAVIEPDNGPTG